MPLTEDAYVGQRVLAEFRPLRTDDLRPGAKAVIGRSGIFERLWVIDEDRPYAGQWAMQVPREWEIQDFIWVPECDLFPAS